MTKLRISALSAFLVFLTASLSFSYPKDFDPDETWIGEDGQVCEFHHASPNFLSCYTLRYYEISGGTMSELRQALRNQGPRGYLGYTDTKVQTGFSSSDECMIAIISVIDLPSLDNLDSLTDSVRERWVAMIQSLETHEHNHHQLAVETAWAEFMIGCPELDSLVDRIDQINREYDINTRHGESEGVKF